MTQNANATENMRSFLEQSAFASSIPYSMNYSGKIIPKDYKSTLGGSVTSISFSKRKSNGLKFATPKWLP